MHRTYFQRQSSRPEISLHETRALIPFRSCKMNQQPNKDHLATKEGEKTPNDGSTIVKPKCKNSLRLKLSRTFSAGTIRVPRTPDSISFEEYSPMSYPSSARSSPSNGSPVFHKPKSRFTWHNLTHPRRNRTSSPSSTSSVPSLSRWNGEDSLPESPFSPTESEGAKNAKKKFVYEKRRSKYSWSSLVHPHSRHSSSPSSSRVDSSVPSSPMSPMTPKDLSDLRKEFAEHKSKSRHSWSVKNEPIRQRSFTFLSNSAIASSKFYTNSSASRAPSSPMTPKSSTDPKTGNDQW